MAIVKLNPEQTANLLAKGIETLLLGEIRAKVQVFRDQIVKEIDNALDDACKAAAEKVVTHVAEFNHFDRDVPELHFHFGFKDKE